MIIVSKGKKLSSKTKTKQEELRFFRFFNKYTKIARK